MKQDLIFQLIGRERDKQDRKWGANRHLPFGEWLAIFVEEVGEVAKALIEQRNDDVAHELIQVAAVCVAWLEDLFRDVKI